DRGGRLQKSGGDARVARKDRAHQQRRRRLRIEGGGQDLEARVVLRENGLLRRLEIVFYDLDRGYDRDRRPLGVDAASRDEPGLDERRRRRDEQQREGDRPIGRAKPKQGLEQLRRDHRHQTASLSVVCGTSAEKRSIAQSTRRGGRKVKNRSA